MPPGPAPAEAAASALADAPEHLKILVTGVDHGAVLALLTALSDSPPARVEELLSVADPNHPGAPGATVTVEFGRIALDTATVMLFATPPQLSSWSGWADLLNGAVGAIVVADRERPTGDLATLDPLEQHGIPHLVILPAHPDAQPPLEAWVRDQLHGIGIRSATPRTPVVTIDARDRGAARLALVTLMEQVMTATSAPGTTPAGIRS
ncbi:hypothetical protein ACIGXM_24915 [Kitasatospora sp. NPDC052896]|uniref:hypothetical protein n=1 Tax=Kitasatospora sp. NPDC052896 TaxID=3364061 RepID=UPI0037C86674